MARTKNIDDGMERIEVLIAEIENWEDAERRQTALDLVQLLMDFHGSGIERMMEITAKAGAAGYAIFDDFARDDLAANLLLLYDQHPVDLKDRIAGAIEKVRPTLSLHDGDVELLDITDRAVKLKLKGSCDGCPSSLLTLRSTIEEAILAAAPDISSIEVDGLASNMPADHLVQIGKQNKSRYVDCEISKAA